MMLDHFSKFLKYFKAKLGYSWIKIDHIADSLLKLQRKIGVHSYKYLTVATPYSDYRLSFYSKLTLDSQYIVCIYL